MRSSRSSTLPCSACPSASPTSESALPSTLDQAAYRITQEALTNVLKHAHAARAEVTASAEGGLLRVEVRDDGLGGANPEGRGLLGLRDRATALGGCLEVENPDRGGTVVTATLPLRSG